MNPSAAVIDIRHLTVRYGRFEAVHELNLELKAGELFGLLGPNGAGKSSTIRVLIGQRRPTSGSVSIAGHDIVRDWDSVKPIFGYVPDRENHFEEFTGRRNLKFFAGLYGVDDKRVEQCLELVELSDAGNLLVRSYSLGMRRKLLLARALLHDPQIMYLDEPTANLDVHSMEVVHRILRKRVEAGGTVLITTHNMEEVEAICDRVGILCKGKLVALDRPLNLRKAHHQKIVATILADGQKRTFNIDLADERKALADVVSTGQVESMQTNEFDFHAAFLKITGTKFD